MEQIFKNLKTFINLVTYIIKYLGLTLIHSYELNKINI